MKEKAIGLSENTDMKKQMLLQDRVSYIDIARAFAVFFVVLGHVNTGQAKAIVYSFHMALFFIISGMCMKRRDDMYSGKNLLLSFWKRFGAVMVPYYIWGLFYSKLRLKNLLGLFYGSYEQLKAIKSLKSLWFFPTLFLACVITETILFLFRKSKHFYLVTMVFSGIVFASGFALPHIKPYGWPMELDIALVAAGFMLIGVNAARFFSFIYSRSTIYAAAVCGGLFGAVCLISYHLVPAQYVFFHFGLFENIWSFLVNALLQSFFVISVSVLIDKLLPSKKILTYIGQNTLGIVMIHKRMVERFGEIASSYGYSLQKLVPTVCISLLATFISLLISAVIERIVPAILGKEKKGA